MKEVSHKLSDILKFDLYEVSRIDKSTDREQCSSPLGLGGMGNRRLIVKRYMGVLKRQNVLKFTVVMVAHIYEFTKIDCML